MRQSSRALWTLPACLLALLVAEGLAGPSLRAQNRYRVNRAENFRRDPSPSGALLAQVNEGVEMEAHGAQGGWVEVTLDGWVWARSLEETTREGHDLVVTPQGGENLRAGPNGRVLARLSTGTLLDEVERQPGWVHVRRTGWMFGRSLTALGTPVTSPPSDGETPAGAGSASADTVRAGLDHSVTTTEAELRREPDGPVVGSLQPETPVKVLARSGNWVRVQTEAWVLESDLEPAAAGILVGVTGAEVRTRPSEFEGKLVQWTVQAISIQEADELRREMPDGQPYLLARGPLPEAGFVYIMLSAEQRDRVERLSPLAELEIVGRIRAGRSRYLGNPVLELVEMQVRGP